MKEDKLKMLMAKKKGSSMSDNEKEAKMGVMRSLSSDMAQMMKDKLSGLKKVSVASDSPEGLKEGLDKAKQMVEGHDVMTGKPMSGDEESPEHEMEESSEEEKSEHDGMEEGMEEETGEMSEDELNAKIEELMKKKASLKK